MSTNLREIVKQGPPPAGMVAKADDRFQSRIVWNAGSPISLAENSGSRFVGKFKDDVLPAKRPVFFQPGMARSTGLYEHPAFIGTQSDMGSSHVDSMLSVPVNSTANGSSAPLTAYNNNPKFCAYLLMRDYERRGLCLFESMKGVTEEEFFFLFDLIIPPHVEKEWAKSKRTVLEHEFRGPFLDQYKGWLGNRMQSPMKTWYNANIRELVPKGLDRQQSDKLGAMVMELRNAVLAAWRWENTVLNTTEQQVRRYRNGHKGKEFYDMPDERFTNPVPPLDLICLADTARTPIDAQQAEAMTEASANQQQSMADAMEVLGTTIAQKLGGGVTMEQIDKLLEEKLAVQVAHYEAEIEKLKGAPEAPVS